MGAQRGWRRSRTALTELPLFVFVICSACFSAERNCTNHPHVPTCKAKANEQGKRLRNQDSLHVLYAS